MAVPQRWTLVCFHRGGWPRKWPRLSGPLHSQDETQNVCVIGGAARNTCEHLHQSKTTPNTHTTRRQNKTHRGTRDSPRHTASTKDSTDVHKCSDSLTKAALGGHRHLGQDTGPKVPLTSTNTSLLHQGPRPINARWHTGCCPFIPTCLATLSRAQESKHSCWQPPGNAAIPREFSHQTNCALRRQKDFHNSGLLHKILLFPCDLNFLTFAYSDREL